VFGLQFSRRLGRPNIFPRRLGMNICFHRADDNFARLFVFTHEPLVLFVRDHLARLASGWPQGQPANRCVILPAH
jgi:hypothetical protein